MCGCSLVRLGVTAEQSPAYRHEGEEHRFCCQPCLDLFAKNPMKYLEETKDLIVYPTCLAEKPRKWAAMLKVGDQEVWFCRCPYCAEVFETNPNYYLSRLAGNIPNQGVLGHEGCCIRPEQRTR